MTGPPLRVLHVIDTLCYGGAEMCLVAGLPELRSHGIEPTVLAWKQPLSLASALRDQGVSVLTRASFQPMTLASFDVVHTHLQLSSLIGRLMALPSRRPVVTSLHGLDYSGSGYGRWKLRWYADRLTNRLYPSTFVAVSEAVQRDYERHLSVPSTVIANPVEIGWLEGLPSRAEARERLGLDRSAPVALMVANLRWIKGHDVLAEAARRCPGVTFAVAGRASDKERRSIGTHLRWLGGLERSELRWWLAAADVGVIPSRVEAFSLVAVEMMAAGLPLIASSIPGLGDTVGTLARKVPPGDAEALAEAIKRTLAEPFDRAAHLARGQERARLFSPARWGGRMSALYRGLVR